MASEASDECIGRVKPPTYAPWQVTACSDGGVYYWNVTSASLLHEQSFVHKDWATSVALLRNGYNGCNGCSVFCTSPPPHLSLPFPGSGTEPTAMGLPRSALPGVQRGDRRRWTRMGLRHHTF